LLHRQKDLIGCFSRITWSGVSLCIVSIAVTLVLSAYQADQGHPQLGLIRAGFALGYAIMMWSLVALSIGLFKRFFDRPSKSVQYIADASYWLYLVHLPIVVWLQIAFAELPFHWSLKLIAISLLTIGISLVLYDLFVRSTLIGKTLNGRTKARFLFRRGLKETAQVTGVKAKVHAKAA
jgi:peptidoglycan/LPS O-acetylase OafA/YrhL